MKKKSLFLLVVLVLVIPFLFSLRNQQTSTSKKKYKDSLVIATDMPIGYVNPLTMVGMSTVLVRYVYSPLFYYGNDEELYPLLAVSYKWENDGKSLRVILKDIDAIDVKKTFEYFKTINNFDLNFLLENFKSTEIVSNREVIFHLTKYDRLFLEYLTGVPMIAFSKDDWTTGPFRVLENSDQHIVLKRKKLSHHLINFIKVYRIDNPQEAFKNLLENKIDLLWYAQRIDKKSFNDHSQFYSFLDNEKTLMVLAESRKSIDWNEISHSIDDSYMRELFGSSFDRPAESLLHPESKWYIKNFSSNLLKETELRRENRKLSEQYELLYFDAIGRSKQLSLYLKSKIEAVKTVYIDLVELNTQKKICEMSEKQSIWLDKKDAFFLISLAGERPFLYHYFYFKDPGDKPLILNYKNPTVDYYLDQARYTQDFKEARYALNRAVEEIKADPPGLFLFWMRMPLVMRKACRLSTELGPRYFFQALDEVECVEEGSSEAGS